MERREQLRAAYRATDYVVLTGAGEIVARIGQPAPALDALLADQGVAAAAFLTAWNPASELADTAANRAAHARLRQAVAVYRTMPTEHRDPVGQWPVEQGLLVLGIDRAVAVQLTRDFAQNAMVYISAKASPELVWTGD